MTPELFFHIFHTANVRAAEVGCKPELAHHKGDKGGALIAETCWGQVDFSTGTLWVDLKKWQGRGK